jgi:hypothetical protein
MIQREKFKSPPAPLSLQAENHQVDFRSIQQTRGVHCFFISSPTGMHSRVHPARESERERPYRYCVGGNRLVSLVMDDIK